jgi:RsiW-degrading membrane proteinase PrsW (M82 family)
MISNTNVLIFSFLGGILPACFWLWFWLQEDKQRPEPKTALLSAFLGGIVAVFLALFFELIIYYLLIDADLYLLDNSPKIFIKILQDFTNKYNLNEIQDNFWFNLKNILNNLNLKNQINISDLKKIALVVFIAPFFEELFKLFMAYSICLRRKINDEPIDASIYMLTTALGFAAIETTLFLTEPLATGKVVDILILSNFRSIGPMLIHIISSATLGLFLGLAFYKNKIKKFWYLITGLIIAIILHSLFNFFILLNGITHNLVYLGFACISTWFLIIVTLIFFKKVKKITISR